jgi:hypothetical protein
MLLEIGHVEAICRYFVKSMRGERLEGAGRRRHGCLWDDLAAEVRRRHWAPVQMTQLE